MKKILTIAMFVGLSITSKAQLNQSSTMQQGTEMVAQNTVPMANQNTINLNIGNESLSSISQSDINQDSFSDFVKSKKRRSKLKPWHYVVIGVAVVLIVAFAIIAPNGVSSR